MSVFQRGSVWWYEIRFAGGRIRESTKSTSKTMAKAAEQQRRLELTRSHNNLPKKSKSSIQFGDAAKEFMEKQVDWKPKTHIVHNNSFNNHLKAFFGHMALNQITHETIEDYQIKRRKEKKASGRTINIEISLVRLVLRKHKLWERIKDDVKMLEENEEIGRALSEDEKNRLLAAAKASASRSLYPAIMVSVHTGLRNEELRLLRWRQIDLINRQIIVGKSKTAAGKGRNVPLNQTAWQILMDWRSCFPHARPEHAVWPREEYSLVGKKGLYGGTVEVRRTHAGTPMGSWKRAWGTAKKAAGVECRWHDLRHTFISGIAEGGAPDTAIQAIAGWMSDKMVKRYSHVRDESKRAAVAVLDKPSTIQ